MSASAKCEELLTEIKMKCMSRRARARTHAHTCAKTLHFGHLLMHFLFRFFWPKRGRESAKKTNIYRVTIHLKYGSTIEQERTVLHPKQFGLHSAFFRYSRSLAPTIVIHILSISRALYNSYHSGYKFLGGFNCRLKWCKKNKKSRHTYAHRPKHPHTHTHTNKYE